MQLMTSEQKLVFSGNRCATVLPGMLQSVRDLIILSTSERRNFNWGFVTSAIILGGHAGELLLKYKLEREGKSFEETHDLYKLYQQLEEESKDAIQREFDGLLSEADKSADSIPIGWHSAESVIKKRTPRSCRMVLSYRNRSKKASSISCYLPKTLVYSGVKRIYLDFVQ